MWNVLGQSVRGPAHEVSGQPCQDSCLVRLRPLAGGEALLLAVADGAGSAALSHVGSSQTCEKVTGLVLADLDEGLPITEVDRDTALSWLVRLRWHLGACAREHGAALPDLACTLLLAVVTEEVAVFAQVGDGAIVALDPDGAYRPVFWPQSGEYANTTFFVTDETAADRLDFRLVRGAVDELALMSDGVQGLALTYADRSAHQPFFRSLFARVRQGPTGEDLSAGLARFLDSAPVRARSDDDKTLILATRASP
jgi:hypothetical protein